jgi:hypothetical protein
VISWPDLLHAVRETVLAHEIGHALRAISNVWTPYTDEELAADWIAGALDAVLDRDAELGALVVDSLGCNVRGCSHPPSGHRVDAYLAGYDASLTAELAAG